MKQSTSSDPFFFMNTIIAARSLRLSEEEGLAGNTLVSAETDQDVIPEEEFGSWIHSNFETFIKFLRYLRPADQELLLSYYLLGKSQTQLGKIFDANQTMCSFKIRMAVKHFGAFLMLGVPTVERMRQILTAAGLEEARTEVSQPRTLKNLTPEQIAEIFAMRETSTHGMIQKKFGISESTLMLLFYPKKNPAPPTSLASLIHDYAEMRNFGEVAKKHKVHRPDVRKWMSRARKQLMDSPDPEQQALGAYLFALTDGSWGLTPKQKSRFQHRKDPAILGQFRVKVDDPDFKHCFAVRASSFNNNGGTTVTDDPIEYC